MSEEKPTPVELAIPAPTKDVLSLNLSYNAPVPTEGQKQLSNPELSVDYLNFAVNNAHPQGLEGQQRRIWGRLQRKLDKALDNQQDSIDLEQSEKDFLRKAFEACKMPAHLSKYFIILEDEVERVTARK